MMPTWTKYLAPPRRAARAVRPSPARRWPRPFRPTLEQLERRDTPALQLLYGGPGTALTLSEAGAAAADSVTVSEPAAGTLRIDLNGATFDAGSTAVATGLTYQNSGGPGTSTFATVDISAANAITVLTANLGGLDDTLALGMTNAAGGVRSVVIDGQAGNDTVTLN